MELQICGHEYQKDVATKQVVDYLQEKYRSKEGNIYYQYPLLKGGLDEEYLYPDISIISKQLGMVNIIVSPIIHTEEIEKELKRAVRIDEIIYSKFLKSDNALLKSRRTLSFPFKTILLLINYADNLDSYQSEEVAVIKRTNEMEIYIEEKELNEKIYYSIIEEIENTDAIIKPEKREVKENNTKADKLNKIEQEIATLDNEQRRVAYVDIEGPQGIKGLAGSGKTILLCMRVAFLHYKYPNKKILYTFFTRSLYDYAEQLITRFYKKLGDGKSPDFENRIFIRHSWGTAGCPGVYTDTCAENNLQTVDFRTIPADYHDKLDYVCRDALKQGKDNILKKYDYIIVDEAQDCGKGFFWLCDALVKNHCIIWGYDACQNIFDIEMQEASEFFKNPYIEQKEIVEIPEDIILKKCYRNPYEILVTAHAIGFGIYNSILIQSFQDNKTWTDMGYIVEQGNCKKGDRMIISRPIENTPRSFNCSSDIINFYSAEDMDEEVKYVCECIEKDIKKEGLKPNDIAVISLDDRYAKTYFEKISRQLIEKEIYTNNLSSYSYKGFYKENCVTLSTVYKAKGNEAASVYVVGCDAFEQNYNTPRMRNKIFTAFTRAKAWLTITGISIEKRQLLKEIEQLKINEYKFKFTYVPMNEIKSQRKKLQQKQDKELLKEKIDEMSPEKIKEMLKIVEDERENYNEFNIRE